MLLLPEYSDGKEEREGREEGDRGSMVLLSVQWRCRCAPVKSWPCVP